MTLWFGTIVGLRFITTCRKNKRFRGLLPVELMGHLFPPCAWEDGKYQGLL